MRPNRRFLLASVIALTSLVAFGGVADASWDTGNTNLAGTYHDDCWRGRVWQTDNPAIASASMDHFSRCGGGPGAMGEKVVADLFGSWISDADSCSWCYGTSSATYGNGFYSQHRYVIQDYWGDMCSRYDFDPWNGWQHQGAYYLSTLQSWGGHAVADYCPIGDPNGW